LAAIPAEEVLWLESESLVLSIEARIKADAGMPGAGSVQQALRTMPSRSITGFRSGTPWCWPPPKPAGHSRHRRPEPRAEVRRGDGGEPVPSVKQMPPSLFTTDELKPFRRLGP